MKLHNLVEDHALEAYTQVRAHFPTFCGCDLCRGDALVYAHHYLTAKNRVPAAEVEGIPYFARTEVCGFGRLA